MRFVDRRDFLKGIGAATLGAGCKAEGPGTPADTGDPLVPGIDHVVFVMMENRSFDHYLGSLALEGRADIDGLDPSMSNESPQGTHVVHPTPADAMCPADPPHGWSSSHAQFADGTNSGFAQAMHDRHGDEADAGIPMGYQTRATLPVTHALADHYTVCTRWFCSVMSSTWPNRLFSHGAQSQGAKSNDLPGGPFVMETIWDQLEAAGIPWSYYYSDLPFIGLFDRADQWSERYGMIEDFVERCAAGTLDPVSYVEPAFSFNDDHPPHHPMLGQMFLATIHNALAASPLWNRTLPIISYDENGGYFDHVPPPTVPDDRADEGFDQLGFRVPTLICGPWVRGGRADDTPYEHSSWLAHVQAMHGLPPLTLRNEAAADLSAALDLGRAEPLEPAPLPVLELTEEEILEACSADGDSGQPELEALLEHRRGSGRWAGETRDRAELGRSLIALGERTGACVVRRR